MKAFRAIDFYGYNISFKYNQMDNYKTNAGALTTILILAPIMAYCIFRFILFSTRGEVSINKKSFFKETISGTDIYEIGNENMDISFKLDDYVTNLV
jgi:hypothetical protein